jgi:hypothetical protein
MTCFSETKPKSEFYKEKMLSMTGNFQFIAILLLFPCSLEGSQFA